MESVERRADEDRIAMRELVSSVEKLGAMQETTNKLLKEFNGRLEKAEQASENGPEETVKLLMPVVYMIVGEMLAPHNEGQLDPVSQLEPC